MSMSKSQWGQATSYVGGLLHPLARRAIKTELEDLTFEQSECLLENITDNKKRVKKDKGLLRSLKGHLGRLLERKEREEDKWKSSSLKLKRKFKDFESDGETLSSGSDDDSDDADDSDYSPQKAKRRCVKRSSPEHDGEPANLEPSLMERLERQQMQINALLAASTPKRRKSVKAKVSDQDIVHADVINPPDVGSSSAAA
ncbi:uncharacterized protein SPPG_09281 [Spizellomyces punctatus DAOM BR117]|uniref:Uncharacterized protein n=1 Tax=Spizellomyces punctatus (strain DAOM BR117) TaxID=645134 RepID=A0A0L0HDZ2_SPIPD|nr:uncharacterized protein SPPG_09281 [Spizellomyces punctatus DAOM BR117]KNC99231.1 hypothetical protein SPPG_09281 [Spizellomyces punctatus DAOM BR117]|eukprot:XP_016607271.1 hypothetical protein SPPG_09281 [Spizellomyces punctatus DAOM BR117]